MVSEECASGSSGSDGKYLCPSSILETFLTRLVSEVYRLVEAVQGVEGPRAAGETLTIEYSAMTRYWMP